MKQPEDTAATTIVVTPWHGKTDEQAITKIDRALLLRSATNPRKHFDEKALVELRDSIIAEGIISPLIVRRSKTVDGSFEIGAGERRWRAVVMAAEWLLSKGFDATFTDEQREAYHDRSEFLNDVPCIVREMSDAQFMALQLTENLRRSDLTPLEEADGYEAALSLRDENGQLVYSMATLAVELGCNYLDIQKARKWSRLPPLARRAFEMGVCKKEHASIIAGIPALMDRRKGALLILFFRWENFDDEKRIMEGETRANAALDKFAAGEIDEIQTQTVAEARDIVAEEFCASLRGCGFSLTDADLVPVEMDGPERVRGGDCDSCLHRTGNDPQFAGQLWQGQGGQGSASGVPTDMCQRTECLRAKIAANTQKQLAEARSAGLPMLSDEDAAKTFEDHGDCPVRRGSDWIDLDGKPGFDLTSCADAKKVKPWSKLLKGLDVPKHGAVDPMGRLRTLVPRDRAVLAVNVAALASGKESPFARAEKPGDRPPEVEKSVAKDADESQLLKLVAEHQETEQQNQKDEKAAKNLEIKLDRGSAIECMVGLDDVIKKGGLGLEGSWLLLEFVLHHASMDGVRVIAELFDVKAEGKKGRPADLTDFIAAIMDKLRLSNGSRHGLESAIYLAAISQQVGWHKSHSEWLKKSCDHFGVNLAEAKKRARERLAPKKKEKKKKEPAPRKPEMKSKSKSVKRGEDVIDHKERETMETHGGETDPELPLDGVGETVRAVGEHCCDECGAELYVAPGKGIEASKIPKGEMMCAKHGGVWQTYHDFLHSPGVISSCPDCHERGELGAEAKHWHKDGCPRKVYPPTPRNRKSLAKLINAGKAAKKLAAKKAPAKPSTGSAPRGKAAKKLAAKKAAKPSTGSAPRGKAAKKVAKKKGGK